MLRKKFHSGTPTIVTSTNLNPKNPDLLNEFSPYTNLDITIKYIFLLFKKMKKERDSIRNQLDVKKNEKREIFHIF
jgi:hypothetical protein